MSWKRTKCITDCCGATPLKNPERKFFIFPKSNFEKRRKWIQNVKDFASGVEQRKSPYICSIHFEDFYLGKKFLKKDAVPTLHFGSELLAKSFNQEKHKSGECATKRYGGENDTAAEDLNVDVLNSFSLTIPSHSKTECDIFCRNCEKQAKKKDFT